MGVFSQRDFVASTCLMWKRTKSLYPSVFLEPVCPSLYLRSKGLEGMRLGSGAHTLYDN